MKKVRIVLTLMLLLCVLLPGSSLAAIPPSPMDAFYVNDYADVIKATDADEMAMIGAALEDACGAQVVAVTVNFLDGLDIDEYAMQLINKWRVGQADKNDGVLILLSVGDREIWTATGTGLEDKLTPSMIGSYHDQYTSYFADDNFSKGMLEDYKAHCEKVASIYGVRLSQTSASGGSSAGSGYDYNYSYTSTEGGVGIMGAIFAIIILVVILSIIRNAFRGMGRVMRPRRFWWFGGWGHPRAPRPPRPPHMNRPHGPPHGRNTGGPSGFGSPRPPSSSGPRTGGGGTSRGSGAGRSFGGSSSSRGSFGGSSGGKSFGGGGSKPSGRSGGGGSSRGGGAGRKF